MLKPWPAELVGLGSFFQSLQEFIRKAAGLSSPALLLGEAGTGKEATAHSIHLMSSRRNRPFLVVDCSLYYERELERELFGTGGPGRKDSFRKGLLEFCSRGTCYLASAEELSASIQERLFNYLESGYLQRVGSDRPVPSKVRLIFSSSKDLRGFAEAGLFSAALFGQLSELVLAISPLRSRSEDIVPFAVELARRFSLETDGEPRQPEFAPGALEALRTYPWPGNYDELKTELLRLFRSGVYRISPENLAWEVTQHWLGRRGAPQVRSVVEEIEGYIQEFRMMLRLDSEYGEVLLKGNDWEWDLKRYDRVL